MFFSFRILFVFLGLLKFTPPLWAGTFEDSLALAAASCEEQKCKAPYQKEILYQDLPVIGHDFKRKEVFEQLAFDQAQIWADTILEGDYEADGNTVLNRVVAVYEKQKLLAYYITYSEKAWDISQCRYDGSDAAALELCTQGRIIESVYLSSDFKDYFFIEKDYAQFIKAL